MTGGYNSRPGLLFLNNRHHDPTLGQFISVDPLVVQTGEPYIYGSANPVLFSDPSGLCSMISGDLWCSGSNYGPSGNGHMSASSVLPEEDPWKAWGIWQTIGDCSTCEGFDIAGGSGNAYLGVSGCAAAADYILYETAGNPAAASDEQFANARWIAANYCHHHECGDGNLLAYANQAEFLASSWGALLASAGTADGILKVGLRQSLDDQLAGGARALDDIMTNPSALAGRTPAEIQDLLSGSPGWRVEALGRGSQQGRGWVFREYTASGGTTGRQIRWHPGGGHHGPDPYWRVAGYDWKSGIIR